MAEILKYIPLTGAQTNALYFVDNEPVESLVALETQINGLITTMAGTASGLRRAQNIMQFKPPDVKADDVVWGTMMRAVDLALVEFMKVPCRMNIRLPFVFD